MRTFRRIKRQGRVLEFQQATPYFPGPNLATRVLALVDGQPAVELSLMGSGVDWVVSHGSREDPGADSISSSFGGDLREQRVKLGEDGWFFDAAPESIE